ncbi:MAG: S8 family serine peptidase [Fimbriimonadales bacterium]
MAQVVKSAIALMLTGAGTVASAQIITRFDDLRAFSFEQNLKFQSYQAQVERWSLHSGWPTTTERGGNTLCLVRLSQSRPVFYLTTGIEAADTVSADEVWPGGSLGLNLNGAGVALALWDDGLVQTDHPELAGRVTNGDGTASVTFHATAVGGVIACAGLSPDYRGFSFGGSIQSFSFTNDWSEMAAAVVANNGYLASNHSYGTPGGWYSNLLGDGKWGWLGTTSISTTQDYAFGFYGDQAAALDTIAYNAPGYLICQANGNERANAPTTQPVEHWVWSNGNWALSSDVRDKDGGTTGFDTLMEQACAKNVLTVGAVDQILGGWTSGSSARSLSNASWGPTDDGRIKPDLVACGGNVRTTANGSGYTQFGGASLACPNVTGSAGLLSQYYAQTHPANPHPSAALLKALMIDTADDCGNAGPDYSFGWGLLNVKAAAQLVAQDVSRPYALAEMNLSSNSPVAFTVVSDGSAPLRVTLVWTDPAASANSPALNNPTPKLVNDLDLRVEKGTTAYMPYVLDPANPASLATTGDNIRDNVEQVLIPTPAAGIYTVRISHKGSFLSPNGVQAFAVAVSGQSTSNLQAISLNPASVIGGKGSTGTVTLDAAAPEGGRTVSLSADADVTVPPSVTVSQGALSANFAIQTNSVNATGSRTVSGSLYGISKSAQLELQRFSLQGVSCNPTKVTGGAASTGTVTLNVPAPTGGATVSLSSDKAAVNVPASVNVGQGASQATFSITTTAVASTLTATLTASENGVNRTTSLVVRAPILSSLTLNPQIIAGGMTTTGRANLSGPAPAGGLLVTLTESSPSISIPASVLIPEGTTFGTFTVDSVPVTGPVQAQIVAKLGTVQRAAITYLYPTTLDSVTLSPTTVKGGTASTGTVNLTRPAPTGGANVVLVSMNPAVANVPGFVTVGSGQLSKTFSVATTPVVANTNVQIQASRNSVIKTRVLTVRP